MEYNMKRTCLVCRSKHNYVSSKTFNLCFRLNENTDGHALLRKYLFYLNSYTCYSVDKHGILVLLMVFSQKFSM